MDFLGKGACPFATFYFTYLISGCVFNYGLIARCLVLIF